jgi:hypothetical protein
LGGDPGQTSRRTSACKNQSGSNRATERAVKDVCETGYANRCSNRNHRHRCAGSHFCASRNAAAFSRTDRNSGSNAARFSARCCHAKTDRGSNRGNGIDPNANADTETGTIPARKPCAIRGSQRDCYPSATSASRRELGSGDRRRWIWGTRSTEPDAIHETARLTDAHRFTGANHSAAHTAFAPQQNPIFESCGIGSLGPTDANASAFAT